MTPALATLLRSRILRRILYGFGLVAAMLSVGLVVTHEQFERLNAGFYDLLEHDIALTDDAAQLERLLTLIQSTKRGYLITGDPEFLARFEEARAAVPGVLARAREDSTGRVAEARLLRRFGDVLDRYVADAMPEI